VWGEAFFSVSNIQPFRFLDFQILFVFMRVAILAQFPVHILQEFAHLGEPKQHYATWLPQLAQGFGAAIANSEWRLADSEAANTLLVTHNSSHPPESLIQNPHPLEIHWVTLSTEVSEPRTVQYLHQTFHILPTAPSGRASSLFRADRRQIQAVIDRINPGLVHGWGNEDVYGLAAVLSGRRNMVSVQGLLSYYVLRNRLPTRTYLQALIEVFVLNRADELVCESRWSCDMVRRRLVNRKKPIHHVEYGVQQCFYEAVWHPEASRPVAVFTGSVEPRKGIQDIVKAFRDPRLKDAELWVLGADNTPFAKKLKENAPPNIKWFGRLGLEESIRHLSRGWCFVLPTRGDTGPMAVKEAMVVGLPVISTPSSGARDYIHDGENGFLVPCGQADVLAERLERLLKNYDTCRAIGEGRRDLAHTEFCSERTTELLIKIYNRL
jgi:glycosyltransferase involved in cell wall biosynthesis